MPPRVTALAEGVLQVSASYCKFHLNSMLDELEAGLAKDAEGRGVFEAHSEKTLNLRNLRHRREQIVPRFLGVLERRLAAIRKPAAASSPNGRQTEQKGLEALSLVEDHFFERHQLLSGMAARCEAQNNAEIHALRQRFSVLSGQAPFTNEELPLGPATLCECLQDAIDGLALDEASFQSLFGIYERRLLGNYRKLAEDCNAYLAGKGILANLNYTTYRNPELRHKKSAIAMTGAPPATSKPAPAESVPPAAIEPAVMPVTTTGPAVGGSVQHPPPHPKAAASGYRFEDFRELLSAKKRLFQQQDGHLHGMSAVPASASNAVPASKADISGILGELQRSNPARTGNAASVQSIKQHIQAQLSQRSSNGQALTLAPEDSDAIDMVGLLMDNALQNFKPDSATSQLMGMLQAPLVRIVLDDKSFFENHVHPARRMLDTLAETGMNWLDVADRDEKLYTNVFDIVSNMSANYDGDSQTLLNAYEETNRLLQTLIRKAEAIERRQVEIAKGRERLSIARTRAEETMDLLLAGRTVRSYTRSILQGAWTDVLVLTELRNGADSQNWIRLRDTAESIILSDAGTGQGGVSSALPDLSKLVLEALQLVGYNGDEAAAVTNRLLDAGSPADEAAAEPEPAADDAAAARRERSKPVFDLDERQLALVAQIKSLPFGTWFDFQTTEWGPLERRKMAWASHVTHHMLFVTPRGQKAAEMRIEELAIEMSHGRAMIYEEDKRGFIQRALDSVYQSLKGILPGGAGGKP